METTTTLRDRIARLLYIQQHRDVIGERGAASGWDDEYLPDHRREECLGWADEIIAEVRRG